MDESNDGPRRPLDGEGAQSNMTNSNRNSGNLSGSEGIVRAKELFVYRSLWCLKKANCGSCF